MKESAFRKVPSYTALRNLFLRIDPHKLAARLNQWLQANLGTLPRALAIDGKWIRDRALSLCLSDHEAGAPVAMGFAKQKSKNDDEQSKDDDKREGEQTVALRLYATTNLDNSTVTGDALNNNKPHSKHSSSTAPNEKTENRAIARERILQTLKRVPPGGRRPFIGPPWWIHRI